MSTRPQPRNHPPHHDYEVPNDRSGWDRADLEDYCDELVRDNTHLSKLASEYKLAADRYRAQLVALRVTPEPAYLSGGW